ncbi:MAG: TraR/DksA family transcriptional regulator [Gammaproteobacteria bacterium]
MQSANEFRAHLIQLKSELEQRIHAIEADHTAGVSADWEEQAVERENDEVLDSLGNAGKARLAQINTALQRLDDGEYFSCAECGAPIPAGRLELLPFTSLCVECAEQLEFREAHQVA